MKNEEKKSNQKQKLNQENKKPTRKSTNQDEKKNKYLKNMTNTKNNMSNIYKIAAIGPTLYNDNKKEKKESQNSFEGKMFYEVNNKSNNYNYPLKTINVYRNNCCNNSNNYVISNLLCDISDDNKNVMVSELDLNISNSRVPTPRTDNIQQNQKRFLEKQNTEVDFKSQLETNIIKILEKNLVNNNNNEENKEENKKESEEDKNINIIDLNKEEKKMNIINKNIENKNKLNEQNNSNKYLSKINNREIKNKYFLFSSKSRKSRGMKSPNINIQKVNSQISPSSKKYRSKKINFNNYTKTDICVKKYKTIIDNNNINVNYNIYKNTNQINPVKYNQIKSKNKKIYNQTQNTTSKKAIKSYFIYKHNLANNKILSPNNNDRHLINKIKEKSKSKNIILTNNSNNNLDINSNSTNQNEKMNYSKYKHLLNELQKNLSKNFQQKEENDDSRANSHRNKKNRSYLVFNLESNNGRKFIKKEEIISSNINNTIGNKYNINSLKKCKMDNLNKNKEENNKNKIVLNNSIEQNLNNKLIPKNNNCLIKQNSDNNLLQNLNKKNLYNNEILPNVLPEKKRSNKNNSCQLNQKINNFFSDSLFNINYKINSEKSKYKFKNNLSLFGIEKINLEINQKSNNSNIEIKPKDLLEETNNEKEIKNNKVLNTSQIKKKNSELSKDKNIVNNKSKKKEIINKKINMSNNNKSNNKNNLTNNNTISFRNKFVNNISIKKHLSNSRDNKEKEIKEKSKNPKLSNKINKNYFYNNNINLNYKYNYNHFSPINRMKNKSSKKTIKEGNKINIDINFNNNINYIYIIKTKKSKFKTKSNNHFCTMK